MTYCVGMRVRDGLVMIADTRTNAGVDNISVYRKLHVLARGEERLVVAATAGNLSVTQLVLANVAEGLPPTEDGGARRRLADVPSMFRAAQLIGEAVAHARSDVRAALEADKISAGITMLVGGRIGNEPLKLYLVYGAGNFIECGPDQPFMQVGETKYGKPILDRALGFDTPLDEAIKVGLISFDSTIRSNLAVGRPLDLIAIPADATRPPVERRIERDDLYFNDLSARWSMLLSESRATIPSPPFLLNG